MPTRDVTRSSLNYTEGDVLYVGGAIDLIDNGELRIDGVPIASTPAAIVTPSSTTTLTNKRRQLRVVAIPDAAGVALSPDTMDIGRMVAVSQGITVSFGGTPAHGEMLELELTSAASQTIAYGASARATADVALVTATTGAGKLDRLLFQYDSAAAKWDAAAKNMGA